MTSCRDGGDLSVRQFFRSRTHMEANQRNARWTAVAASFCRPGHRHLGGVGLRPLDFRIVAMEAIYLTKAGFQSRTYMEANQRNARWTATVAFAVLSRWRRSVLRGQFSEVGRKWWCRGQPSSGRWRQEHAAGEAAQRMSALSGIGAGKYESVATAAGGDDADNSSPGGVLTCSASMQTTAVGIALQIPVAPAM